MVKLIFGVSVLGRDNFDFADKFIIISNHNSHLDILLLFSLLPLSKISITHPVAEETYFSKSKIIYFLVGFLLQPIWITRGKPEKGSDPFAGIKAQLDSGHNVIIFPEGSRGKPGEMQSFKSGIGRLVVQYPGLPIIPVYLSGPERSLPKASYLLLPLWNHIIIGPPQICTGTHKEITRQLESVLTGLSHSESARQRQRKATSESPPLSVAVLGIDGSGKSTISKHIAVRFSAESSTCLISDRLDLYENTEVKVVQPLGYEKVRKVISNYAKKAKSLKLYKIPKMTELLLRNHLYFEVRRWYNPEMIVMDGSPLLNMTAWAVLYRDRMLDEETCAKIIMLLTGREEELKPDDPIFSEFKESQYFRSLKLNNLILPDIVIFIDLYPETANTRIAKRGEDRQVHETSEKLARLREAYKMVCKVIRDRWDIPVSIIDGEESLEAVSAVAERFITEVIRRKEGKNDPTD
ncbi:MAG: 1-acyl-sn-glycerol-3-phosphate acyltransferase [Candidatus Hatepunaea meridiana]|nr:1-acyl-sn-glycerol-3-phosphate acyltransferase [Candidatus Hatepunaea meridiana]